MTMTKDQQAASATTMATGVRTVFSAYPLIYVNGTATPPADAATKLDFYASLRAEVDRSKAAYEAALDKEDAHATEMTAYMAGVTRFVRAAVGNDPEALERFGIPPIHARTPQTVDEKAAAVAKRESTREARGTKGSRQKLAIHGAVTGVTITPVAPTPPPATAAVTPETHTK